MSKAIQLLIGIIIVLALYPVNGYSAQCVLSEDFDDQALDERLTVYGKNWQALSPPQYNLNAAGRNAGGYAFSSGTTNMAHLCWMGETMLSPWPTDELYVSFWMRYPTFSRSDSMENLKVFYPHWENARSYVHFTLSDSNTIYYSAMANGTLLTGGNWLDCPGQTDGAWHHYEFYINFAAGISRFWYDGKLKVDDIFGTGVWTNSVYSIMVPSIDGEEPGNFSRQVDDLDIWDGMPAPGDLAVQNVKPLSPSGLSLQLVN
ncbi:MAG: hypothetical protein WDA72_00855 [Desulfomonilia bacterium]|nr:hypothetical protein [Deltaproteobacteria bacterium]HPW68460.1 hypothetical protein [Deltaproteobacteria bacterium]